ncbi:MAG: hypothetical protein IJV40_07500 [Oscillospiraceae bacterium]|nr:hypothetical protein [Oscillospiraceae bacterium]
MRTDEEKVREILRRGEIMKTEWLLRRKIAAEAASLVLCLVLIITVCAVSPALTGTAGTSNAGRYGSLILTTPDLAVAVIGLLCFAAGFLTALLCKNCSALCRTERRKP